MTSSFGQAYALAEEADQAMRRAADVEFRYARRFRLWEQAPAPAVAERLIQRRHTVVERVAQMAWLRDRLWTRASTAMPVHPASVSAAMTLSSTLAPRAPRASAPSWLPAALAREGYA